MSLLFIINMSLGLFGFVGVDTLRTTFESALKNNARTLLAADLKVSARRMLTTEETGIVKSLVNADMKLVRVWDLFSMASSVASSVASSSKMPEARSKLVQLRGVEKDFPLYGEVQLQSGTLTDVQRNGWIEGEVFIDQDLSQILGVRSGDDLQIGEKKYRIRDLVLEDSTQSLRFAGFAPRVYLRLQDLQNSGLIQKGSTLTESLLVQSGSQSASQITQRLKDKLADPGIEIQTAEESSLDSGRVLQYLFDYLGLVALVALFLSAIGSIYLLRTMLIDSLPTLAVWNILGMRRQKIENIFLHELAALGAAASMVSLLFSQIFLLLLRIPFVVNLWKNFSPVELPQRISLQSVLMTVALGFGFSLLLGLPNIRVLRQFSPLEFLSTARRTGFRWSLKSLFLFLPAAVLFSLLSIFQAKSFQVAGLFIFGLLIALALFLSLGWSLFLGLEKLAKRVGDWRLKQACLQLARKKSLNLMAFCCLALGVFLLNLVPQLRAALQEEVRAPQSSQLPTFFLFDIQPDQISAVAEFLKKQDLELQMVSPMIRARLQKVNGVLFERGENKENETREDETKKRFRNRGFNLTYRDHLASSEKIVEGEPFSPADKTQAQISVEKRFAERLGLKLGDLLVFDVEGEEVSGKIRNFRTVNWNSFQPNFFVVFQSGFLEDAPQIFLANVSGVSDGAKGKLQTEISRAFPNVSLIDVKKVGQKVIELTGQMSLSLQVMAVLSIISGLFILLSMLIDQLQQRANDMNLLKILGASSKDLLRLLLAEFLILILSATLLGVLLSWFFGASLLLVIFEIPPVFEWQWPLFSALTLIFGMLVLATFYALRMSARDPRQLLKEG